MLTLLITSILGSTILYFFLHHKTRMHLRFLYIDNIFVILLSFLISWSVYLFLLPEHKFLTLLLDLFLVGLMAFTLTMIRFWRTPHRRSFAQEGEVLSPADGNIIYIEKVSKGDIPKSVKRKLSARLTELSKTNLLDDAGWLIGINMTPFDVHKNCAPVEGKITFSKHTPGSFLSLKDPRSQVQNERFTYVISNGDELFGVIQTASRLVRRIDSYVELNQAVSQGQWIGMIRFGSQVDLIIPSQYQVQIQIGDQVYAGQTIISRKNENNN